MDRELPVKLTEAEVAERGEIIASKMLRVKQLRKKRREDLRSINAQIESELDNVQAIAETIVSGTEARKQSELFVGDKVEPSQAEAAAALGEVAKRAPEYHKDGALCKRDVCKRRHLSIEQVRAAGIKPEGEELGPETAAAAITLAVGSPCPGCEKPLESATEVVKGLCEKCQTQKPGEDALAGTPEEDVRPRCSVCHQAPLSADDIERKDGMHQACIPAPEATTEPTGEEHPPEDIDPPHAEPESDEHPAVGGEAGA